MSYQIVKGTKPYAARPLKRTKLDALIELGKALAPGDVAVMTYSEAQTFRVILNTLGFDCVTDGCRCTVPGNVLAFKFERKAAETVLSFDI